jgi:hypothetical protein
VSTPQVLASLRHCQHGRCGCLTDQYDRLEDMTIHTNSDNLTLRLHPARDNASTPMNSSPAWTTPSPKRRATDLTRGERLERGQIEPAIS